MKGIIQDKRVRYGGYSVLMTLVAIAILIIINLVAAQLDLKWDMSANKIYSISDDTRNILDGLEADVTIYAMFPTGSANILFKEIIEQYPSRSGRVKLEYRDPVLYPTFLSQYSADIPEYSLLVVSGDRFRIINSNDFIKYEFDYSTWQQYPVAIEIEPLLTGAIRAVCDPDSPVVYRLIGHDESELPPAITEQFSREGYELRDINLILEGVIPDDCDAVIISTPRWDITPDEAKALSGYLMAGGAAALLINPSGVETPNLYDLAAEYGLGFSRSLLVEAEAGMTLRSAPYYMLPALSEHDMNAPLTEKKASVLTAFIQGVETLEIRRKSTRIAPLLTTSPKAYGKPLTGYETVEQEPGDQPGPFDVAVAVEDYTDYTKITRLFVTGTASILDASLDSMVGGANLDFFMNAMAWLTQKSDSVYIRSKSLSSDMLQMNNSQQNFVLLICVILIPLAILLMGIARWLRRRNK